MSANWGGYVAYGGHYTSVSAHWSQPSLSLPKGSTKTRYDFWIGIGGKFPGDAHIEQIGTGCRYYAGSVDYYAWCEMYPAHEVSIDMTVRPGDAMAASVTSRGQGIFVLTLLDRTSGHSFTTTQKDSRASRDSAEAIVEWPRTWKSDKPGSAAVRFTQCLVDGRPLGSFDLIQEQLDP